MKHWRYILFCLFAATLGCCTDEDAIDDMQKLPKEGILIRLSNGALVSTKTDLNSSANLHHVEEVHAFLYEGDATDQANASCVLSEKLNWNPMDSLGYGVDSVQVEEYLLENTLNLPSGNYTLLCVGLDDRSGSTYNLPAALNGKSLAEAKATLADAKTKNDIAHSELFAGWETFEYKRGALSRVDVEMRRRVAGVLCYLKDIPYTLTEGLKTYRITRVRLRLSGNQNSAVSLLRPKAKDVDDFGDTPLEASDTILSCVDLVKAKYGKQGTKNLYAIPVLENEFPKRQANTILMGAYLLPVKNENGDTPTLIVEVLGKSIASVDDKPADDAEEVVVKSFPAVQETAIDAPNRLRYSIRPNVIYHIGQKSSNGSTDGDYPESLAGTKLNLKVTGWERDTVDVEFPGVPINPTIALVNENGGIYDAEKYIFDCMGTNTIRLRVYPSILKDPWKVTIIDEGSNMLLLQKSEGEYSKEYKSSVTTKNMIPLVLTDYVKQGGPETRTVKIRIVSTDTIGQEKKDTEQILLVRQYNAIIVGSGDKARGFSRFNWGTKRSITTGRVTEDNSTSDWGYYSSSALYIFGNGVDGSSDSDGNVNYRAAKGGSSASDGFNGSAIQKCAQKGYSFIDNKISVKEAGWYLPAWEELETFLNNSEVMNNKEKYHIKDKYWSSNSVTSSAARSWAYKWNGSKYASYKTYRGADSWHSGENDVYLYLRPACAAN